MNTAPDSSDRLQAENERLRQAVEELSILNEISTAIDSSMKVDEINKLIVTKCIRRMGVEQGVIRLLDESDPNQAFKTLIRVVDDSKDGIPFRLGLSLTGWMIKNAGYPMYAMAKSAVHGLVNGLARELDRDRIRINALVPGWVITEKQKRLWLDEEGEAQIARAQCLPGHLKPEDLARMALFLAADDSRMCTGQDFIVDGGWV